jgi:peroxiredoxin
MLTDSLKGAKFEITAGNTKVIYDGRKKTTIYAKDSLAIIHDKWKYPLKLTGVLYHLLPDFFVGNLNPLKDLSANHEIKKQLMKDTTVANILCFHLLLQPADDETLKSISRHLFISKDKYYLIGEVIDLESHQHRQYSELILSDVQTNVASLSTDYSSDLIPEGFFTKEYVPDDYSKLLSSGTPAPSFHLSSADGKNYSLSNLSPEIKILYFWNGLDQQCRLGLVPLQRIADKYSSVKVIGLNVADKGNESIKKYINKEKITFLQLLNAANTGEKYNILNVPTIYVLDKSNKIIEGFAPGSTENFEKRLEAIILKNQ